LTQLVATEKGYGKRTKLVEEDGVDVYRITQTEVVKEWKTLTLPKNGSVNFIKPMYDLMIID
jgi:DNA gyrase subunit A